VSHEEWGEGPWNSEDDHAVWVDPTSDLDCMINRGPSGALCGYVGVGPKHSLHGVSYGHVDVDVHGGLTYSDACQENGEICHVPQPGREHDIWWFGFDCAHAFDLAPRIEMELDEAAKRMDRPRPEMPTGEWAKVYRDWAYVQDEIQRLAWQLVVQT